MKTTTMRTIGVIFSAGILLTSCVSSKKYHKSEAEVAKLRGDSATLAQQRTTLQQNLTATEQKNADLQKSVENANTTNSGLQKNVAYYADYAGKEQSSAKQIKDELNTTLAPSGITEQDVTLINGKIYVNVGEKSLFKGNSAMLTKKGKELVDNLGQFVKSHDAVDVSVADLQLATTAVSENGATDNAMASSNTTTVTDQNNQPASRSTANNGTYTKTKRSTTDNTSASTDKTAHKMVAVHHKKKIQPVSGESKAVAYSSGHHNKYTTERSNRSMARVMAWKRQNVVADALLKDGIPKVKLVAQNQPGADNTGANSNAQKGVQIVLVHDMDNFYKHMSEAPVTGQPVSKNP